jgi:hypothetical protein
MFLLFFCAINDRIPRLEFCYQLANIDTTAHQNAVHRRLGRNMPVLVITPNFISETWSDGSK